MTEPDPIDELLDAGRAAMELAAELRIGIDLFPEYARFIAALHAATEWREERRLVEVEVRQ